MSTTIGVVGFVLALLLSVMIHEAGHFATARAFGMKATEFFCGFGPKVFSFRRGETEYGLKAIPAGGYVKIVGMTSLEETDPADEDRLFYKQPAWQRAIVLAAGSVMHFVIGFLLLFAVLVGLGQSVATTTVATIAECVPATPAADCPAGAESPAKAAGLQPGDRVVSFQGQPVRSWERLVEQIRAMPAGPVELVVERDGRQRTLRPEIVLAERPSLDDPGRTERVGQLGVSPELGRERDGVVEGLGNAADGFGTMISATFKGLAQIPEKMLEVFSPDRGIDSPTSVVGIGRISGDVASAETDWQSKLSVFLLIMASLNVFVGIFNLLPLLPLDGGHLAVLIFEQARFGVYRLLGRPSPGRVNLMRLMPLAYVVIVLFVGLSLTLVAADIVNPIPTPF
ncbi:MAG: site-2 protease family protein [Actinomycetota bacterium]|nr:site-2 protease family protein [Actinomycetota bacterium]